MGSHNNITIAPQKTPQEIEAEKQLAAQKEVDEQKKNQVNAKGEQGGFLGILSGVFQIFAKLIETIFGAFTDTKSEFSEIDERDAKPNNFVGTARERADVFLKTVGDKKLKELAKKYEGQKLHDISPFQSTSIITSGLGARNIGGGASRDHKGIDLVPANGESNPTIYNTMPGIVVRSETQYNKNGQVSGFGHWVEVACIDGTRRRYAHLKKQGVPVGTVLEQGDPIGTMGNSGTSVSSRGGDGSHLHYEWRDKNGNVLEPKINDKTYARNDKSYVQSRVAASGAVCQPASPQKTGTETYAVADASGDQSPCVGGSKPKPSARLSV